MHFPLGHRLGLKFLQLYKYEMETVYYFVRVFIVNEVIVMVVFFHLRLENVIDEVERIDRLQLAERLSLF